MKSYRRPIKLSKSRAINQASEVFRNLQSVVWEYITNGLAYTEKGTSPEVIVTMEKDKITFADNGRGMDIEDLDNFFTAHGENRDIKEGNYLALIRGMHGTGSYSVFKFADTRGFILEVIFFFKTNVIGPGQYSLYNFKNSSLTIQSLLSIFKLQ